MKNLPIRRQMTERVGAQSREIHIQFLAIEVLHCTAFGRFRSGDVAGLLIFPNINRHEESPNSETNDPLTVILNAKDEK